MNDSQPTKPQMPVVWIQMTMLMLTGILLAATVSFVAADRQWRKSERQLDAVKLQAEENVRKASPKVEPEEDGTITVPIQAGPIISDADRDKIIAADIQNQSWLNRRMMSKWFATRSGVLSAVLALVLWLLKKKEANQQIRPLGSNG